MRNSEHDLTCALGTDWHTCVYKLTYVFLSSSKLKFCLIKKIYISQKVQTVYQYHGNVTVPPYLDFVIVDMKSYSYGNEVVISVFKFLVTIGPTCGKWKNHDDYSAGYMKKLHLNRTQAYSANWVFLKADLGLNFASGQISRLVKSFQLLIMSTVSCMFFLVGKICI